MRSMEGWGNGPYADLIPLQDQRNGETFREAVGRPLRQRLQRSSASRGASLVSVGSLLGELSRRAASSSPTPTQADYPLRSTGRVA